MLGEFDAEDTADEVPYQTYQGFEEVDTYTEYSLPANQHSIKAYQQMVDEPWLDEPLREIIEIRLEELLEG